jgi:hypothetical protein
MAVPAPMPGGARYGGARGERAQGVAEVLARVREPRPAPPPLPQRSLDALHGVFTQPRDVAPLGHTDVGREPFPVGDLGERAGEGVRLVRAGGDGFPVEVGELACDLLDDLLFAPPLHRRQDQPLPDEPSEVRHDPLR